MRRHDRGAALIMALGILALLTMLIVSFSVLTQVETSAATNYREGERARTLAKSGIERGQAELRRAVTTPGYPLPWLVYDSFSYPLGTFLSDPGLSGAPSLFDVGVDPSGTGSGIPGTKSPSLGMFLSPVPAIFGSHQSLPWPSGVLGGTYYTDPDNPAFRGDYYVLRVTDASAQLYLNDQNPHLESMLDDLVWGASQIGVRRADGSSVSPISGLGKKIIAGRQALTNGFRRFEEVLSLASPTQGPLTADERLTVQALQPYLTLVSRVDQKVVEAGQQPQDGNRAAYLMIQPRAAVNVNLAPLPVLVACLAGIQYPGNGGGTASLGQPAAFSLAQKIISYRQNPVRTDENNATGAQAGNPKSRRWGFQHWGEFREFLLNEGGCDPWEADAILANANPNTDLRRFVPDACVDRIVDKNDLVGGTTEFCFAPGGVFTIESLGIVLDPTGKPIATAKARAVVRAFERYCETTQADFESGRVDPPGANNNIGLRDLTTLPEPRNSWDARILGNLVKDEAAPGTTTANPGGAGMHAAEYDGQLTYNVITRATVAQPLGVYVGFIDRTLEGLHGDGSTEDPYPTPPQFVLHGGGARMTNMGGLPVTGYGGVLGYALDAGNPTNVNTTKRKMTPDFENGSDLHQLAAFLGRGGATGSPPRELSFPQNEVVIGDDHVYGDTEVSMPVTQPIIASATGSATSGIQIGVVNFTVHEKVTDWQYDPLYRMGFELWFKPARMSYGPGQNIILLDWSGGGPQYPQVNTIDFMTDYLAEPVNGGAALGVFFNAGWYNAIVPYVVPNPTHQLNVSWGAGARVTIWLEPKPNPPAGQAIYWLHARFKMQKQYDMSSRFLGNYDKTWTYADGNGTPIDLYAGTWHHTVLSWETPNTKDQCPGEHSFLFVDGNKIPGQNEPDWPTEIDANGQFVIAAVLNLLDYVSAIVDAEIAHPQPGTVAPKRGYFDATAVSVPDPETYRAPAQIAPGYFNVWVGQNTPGNEIPGAAQSPPAVNGYAYKGLMDNVVFDSQYARQIGSGELNNEKYLPRYDTYRPSFGDTPGAYYTTPNQENVNSNFKPLVFRKHTQALDWSRPVRVVAFDVTAWKQKAEDGSGSSDVDMALDNRSVTVDKRATPDSGAVYFHFGWMSTMPVADGVNIGTPAVLPPSIDGVYDLLNAPQGWTQRLNSNTSGGAPYNGVANGYLVPSREPAVPGQPPSGGFITKGPGEYTLYALEMYPFGDNEKMQGPRMAPVVDDVNVVYVRWDSGTVIEEEEVVDTE